MSNLGTEQMREVVGAIIEYLRELQQFMLIQAARDENAIVAAGPVTAEELRRLEQNLMLTLPSSYVQLLTIHNGIESFYWVDGDLLPAKYAVDHPDYSRDWERPDLFFFIMGNSGDAVAFNLTSRSSDGEMEVQEFQDRAELETWPSLSDFLIGYRSRLETWVAEERANRAGLADD